jgi:hypothetical protein
MTKEEKLNCMSKREKIEGMCHFGWEVYLFSGFWGFMEMFEGVIIWRGLLNLSL